MHDCALLCIESAQQMISLVQREYTPGENFGVIPWWHRILYLHLAGTILIAAMLRADLVTPSVTQSWDTAMLVLRAHCHLSALVKQCVTTFQTLSSKIMGAQSPVGRQDGHLDSSGPPNGYFHDLFQDVEFDVDNSVFGVEDMAWLSQFDR